MFRFVEVMKMRKMKRWLGIILSVMLAVGSFQLPVYAAETGETVVEAAPESESIEDTVQTDAEGDDEDLAEEASAAGVDAADAAGADADAADAADEAAKEDAVTDAVEDIDKAEDDIDTAGEDIDTGKEDIDTAEEDIDTAEDDIDAAENTQDQPIGIDRDSADIESPDPAEDHTEQIEETAEAEHQETDALAAGAAQLQSYYSYNAKVLSEVSTISGVSYTNVIKFDMNGNWIGNSGEINYNLHGEYSSVSFVAGFMSGTPDNATMKVIADGNTLLEEVIKYDKVAKTYTLNVAGVKHLRISFSSGAYDTKSYGIANLNFVPAGDIGTHEYTSDEFFDVYNAGVRTNTKTINDSFDMGGNIYNGGYKMTMDGNWIGSTAKINFNFQNHFKEMSFDLGFISGPRGNLSYTIEADDTVLYNSETLPYGSIPKQIKLDLNGVSGVVITVKSKEYDAITCGIGNIQLKSDGTPLGIRLDQTKATLTSDSRQLKLTGGVYPSDANHREYTLRSDTPIVAIVEEDGLVTARNKGTAVIYAESEYVSAPAQCKITSELPKAQFIPSQDGWGFPNDTITIFNDPSRPQDGIDDYYQEVYKRVSGWSGSYAVLDNMIKPGSPADCLYHIGDSCAYGFYTVAGWSTYGGVCFGMAASAALTKTGDIAFSGWKNWEDPSPSKPADVKTFSKTNGYHNSLGLYLKQAIFGLYCTQLNADVVADTWVHRNKYADLIDAVKEYQRTGKKPIVVKMSCGAVHEVMPYEVVDIYDDHIDVYIYDSNLNDGGGDPDLRKLVFTKNASGKITGWSYPGHSYSSSTGSISYLDSLSRLSDHLKSYQSIDTTLKMIKNTCPSFSVTRAGESEPVLKYANGQFTGDTTQKDVVPVLIAGDDFSSARDGLMYQLTDQNIVIHNTGGSDKAVTAITRPGYAFVVESDGESTIQQAENEGTETLVIKPAKSKDVKVYVNHDDNEFVVTGEADSPVTLTYDPEEERIQIDGYDSFDVTVTNGGEEKRSDEYNGTDATKYIFDENGELIKREEKLPGKTSRGDMFNLANNVKVTWKAVPGAKYYKVYRQGVTDPKESRKDPVIVTTNLVGWDKDSGLTNGHAYRYKIVASLTGKGDSSGDSKQSYSKLMYRLKTVVIRSVKNTAPGKVTVKYDRTTSGDSYVLQYGEREDMVGAKTKVVLGAANTSYVIGGLKKGKTYYISIRVRKKVDGIDYYTTFGVAKKVTITK